MEEKSSRLVLIDGNALVHRAYHAYPSLTTSSGELTNAVYGFTIMLLKIINDLKSEYLAVAFDTPGPTFRHKEYVFYKAQRPKMDEELAGQLGRVHEIVAALNIPIFEMAGYEGDDIVGALATQANPKSEIRNPKQIQNLPPEADQPLAEKSKIQNSVEVIIVTGDRDLLQLVNDNIKVYCPLRGLSDPVLYDAQLVEEKIGLRPDQIIDYKALVGDPGDNVPGAPGIGPKTAVEILQKHRDLAGIYKAIARNEISRKNAESLMKNKNDIAMAQRLVTINTNVPITLNLEKCRVSDYDKSKVIRLFEELQFRSLIPKLPGCAPEKEKKEKPENQIGLI